MANLPLTLHNPSISRRYLVFLTLFLLASIVLLNTALAPFTASSIQTDSNYIETAYYLTGQEYSDIFPQRILKPVIPLLVGALSFLMSANLAFLLVNSAIYFAIGLLVFKIAKMLFNDERHAFISSVLFLTAYPVLEYGISFSTDLSGWFFFVLSIYLTLKFLREPSDTKVLSLGLVVALGALTKESGAMGALFFIPAVFFLLPDSTTRKLSYVTKFLFSALVPFLLWQWIVFSKISYSYYDWFREGVDYQNSHFQEGSLFLFHLKSIGAGFLLGWIAAVAGIYKALKRFREKRLDKSLLWVLALLLLPSLSFLLWPVPTSRFVFIAGLLLSILSGFALSQIPQRTTWHKLFLYMSVVIIVAGNYFWLIFDQSLRQLLIRVIF